MADKVHTVQKGETLFGLSRKYDVPIDKLAAANKISTRTKVQTGQRIVVPTSSGRPELPSALKDRFDRVSVKRGRWKNIVIHHSATSSGTVEGMDDYHRNTRHMENGLAYHFVIGNGRGMRDGEIAAGNRWVKQLAGGHLASEALNQVSLGICLVGNFSKTLPSEKQLESLAELIDYLMQRCRLSHASVKTHQQINTVFTECPGKKFPTKKVLALLGG